MLAALSRQLGLGSLLSELQARYGGTICSTSGRRASSTTILLLRLPEAWPLPGEYVVVATNCNGGVKEVLCLARKPERSALWHHRCPTIRFAGELPGARRGAHAHWFDPCALLKDDARSEYREDARERAVQALAAQSEPGAAGAHWRSPRPSSTTSPRPRTSATAAGRTRDRARRPRAGRRARCRRTRRSRFCRMLRMVARDSRRARAMPRRSPLTSVTPALSIATSVPVPIAMPTSACASAGASLMPSPAIATTRPSRCSRLITVALLLGQHVGDAPRRCRAAARPLARWRGCRRSASRRAGPRRAARERLRRRGLDRIGDADQARQPPSTATNITVWPVARAARRRARPAPPASTPSVVASARDCRAATRRPSTVPRHALARSATRSPTPRGSDAARARRPRRSPRASGCSLPRSSAAASAQHVVFVDAGRRRDRDQARLALGQRAGLVDDQRVDFPQQLDRLGVLEQHARAARLARWRP